jgi:hypothetical protein
MPTDRIYAAGESRQIKQPEVFEPDDIARIPAVRGRKDSSLDLPVRRVSSVNRAESSASHLRAKPGTWSPRCNVDRRLSWERRCDAPTGSFWRGLFRRLRHAEPLHRSGDHEG